MPTGYREDLAYIHDAGYGHLARGAAAAVVKLLQNRHHKGVVVDLGCGSGILSAIVAAAGYDVVGYDLSPAMIRLARRRVPAAKFPAAKFVVASFLDVKLPPCIAVAAVGEIFNFQFDRASTPATFERMLRAIHAALLPGGVLIFDVAAPGRAGPTGKSRGHALGEDWACLVTANEDRRRGTLVRHITAFRRRGKLYRRSEEMHELRLIRPADAARSLKKAGFTARRLKSYADVRLPHGLAAFVAEKPGEMQKAT